jgi:hypothetical protein
MPVSERHDDDPVFLDQRDAAELTRLNPRTLEKKRLQGNGPPFIKVGRRVLYDREDLIAWMRQHRRTSTSDEGAA